MNTKNFKDVSKYFNTKNQGQYPEISKTYIDVNLITSIELKENVHVYVLLPHYKLHTGICKSLVVKLSSDVLSMDNSTFNTLQDVYQFNEDVLELHNMLINKNGNN